MSEFKLKKGQKVLAKLPDGTESETKIFSCKNRKAPKSSYYKEEGYIELVGNPVLWRYYAWSLPDKRVPFFTSTVERFRKRWLEVNNKNAVK